MLGWALGYQLTVGTVLLFTRQRDLHPATSDQDCRARPYALVSRGPRPPQQGYATRCSMLTMMQHCGRHHLQRSDALHAQSFGLELAELRLASSG